MLNNIVTQKINISVSTLNNTSYRYVTRECVAEMII